MNKKIKLLVVENKIGMAKKIVDCLTAKQMNIIKMEINPPYISVELEGAAGTWNSFERWLKIEIPEVISVEQLDMLDFEKRAIELQTIIDSMNVGVISLGKTGEILYYNKIARQLFTLVPSDINKTINNLVPRSIYDPDRAISDKDSLEFSQVVRNKEVHLFIDIRLVRNEQGEKVGALLILKKIEEVRRLMQSISRPSMNTFDDIIGESQSIRETKQLAKLVAQTESSIMILGESGTGKELFARAIHLSSTRSAGPFVAVNCSAVPENLIESEFFGYEKGSFTGASNSGKQGLFELATGGSIFLDEIGDLPIHLQAKILRAIQERKIRRIGGKKEIAIDARIISATHHDLQSMVKEGTFREDLYYRLNVVPVHIRPLRERKEDIPVLTKYFMETIGEKMGKDKMKIAGEALEKLKNYSWPGNIRELQNVIERAVIFAEDIIEVEHLIIEESVSIRTKDNRYTVEEIKLPVDLSKILEEIERKYIMEARKNYQSSREIARALGISHTTVLNKIKAYEQLL